MYPKKCKEVSPQCPTGQEEGYRLGWYHGQIDACNDYHGTPCEQIRHTQEIERLRAVLEVLSCHHNGATVTWWQQVARDALLKTTPKL